MNRTAVWKTNPVLKVHRAQVECVRPNGAQLQRNATNALLRTNDGEEEDIFDGTSYVTVINCAVDNNKNELMSMKEETERSNLVEILETTKGKTCQKKRHSDKNEDIVIPVVL